MKIEKLIKIAKPLNCAALKKIKGGTNDGTQPNDPEVPNPDGIIQDDLLAD